MLSPIVAMTEVKFPLHHTAQQRAHNLTRDMRACSFPTGNQEASPREDHVQLKQDRYHGPADQGFNPLIEMCVKIETPLQPNQQCAATVGEQSRFSCTHS